MQPYRTSLQSCDEQTLNVYPPSVEGNHFSTACVTLLWTSTHQATIVVFSEDKSCVMQPMIIVLYVFNSNSVKLIKHFGLEILFDA